VLIKEDCYTDKEETILHAVAIPFELNAFAKSVDNYMRGAFDSQVHNKLNERDYS